MANRKINRVGVSTLTVSLPSKWVKIHNLKPGDELDVREDGSQLVVRTQGAPDVPKKVKIHLKKGQPLLRRHTQIMYKKGCDEIEITSEDPFDMQGLKYAIGELLGFELIESSPKRIVVRNVTTPNESEFDNIFRRLFLLTVSMSKSLLDDLKSGNYAHTNEIADLEYTSNKLCAFCHRILTIRDLKSRVYTLTMYRFAGELEQIADNLKRIAMDVHKEKKPLNKHVLVAFEHYVALVESLFEVFHKSDSDTITSLRDKRNEVRDEILSTFARKGLRSVDCVVLTWLFGILTCIKNIETEMYHV